jgi:hypothetical protein
MIPKIVHYCWFGGNEMPKDIKENIDKWKELLPDYEFMIWDEKNFPIDYNLYVQQAYDMKKYAFVSDVARIYALCNYGGIYLDTDIVIKRSFNDLLDQSKLILGYENYNEHIMTAFIAAEKNNVYMKKMLETYTDDKFVFEDGKINDEPNTIRLTNLIKNEGFDVPFNEIQSPELCVYKEEIFSAMRFYDMVEISNERTYTVHHFKSSWKPWYVKLRRKIKIFLFRILRRKNYKR